MRKTWGPLDVTVGATDVREVGAVTLRTQRVKDEWMIASAYGNSDEEPDWTRIVTSGRESVFLQPALPDRAVVIRPRSPIVILPGRFGRFFFSVPLWIRYVSESSGKKNSMLEIPTQQLSSTWFGDMETGELCYSVDSRLLREMSDEDADEAYARCEIEIRNNSRERLRFERICVHVEFMTLFSDDERFWSNRVRVSFKGAEQVSQLSYTTGPPEQVSGAKMVCEPRHVMDKNIFKRSFNLIREITGI